MKKLLNTLYVMSPNRYLSLDGLNVVASEDKVEVGRVPLHNIQSIVSFSYVGISPALIGACNSNNINITFLSQSGKFLGAVYGPTKGNVLLRKQQYKMSDNELLRLSISKNFILGKIYNSKWVIERATRDYELRLDVDKLKQKSRNLSNAINLAKNCKSVDELRGIEGEAASNYFSVFDDLILQQKDDFKYTIRSKRPPMDKVNAMLSFSYSLLTGMCASALESVGLDPYVGFMHTDRPGRASLALDLMEELRSIYADRFVLTLINKRIINSSGFETKESGVVIMTDQARKTFLSHWQEKKQEIIKHPFLEEKTEWGMIPYTQALLLARYIRNDIDEYPTFLWK